MRVLTVSTRIELALFLREPAAVFFTLALPALLLSINASGDPWSLLRDKGLTQADAFLPGLTVMVMLTGGLMAMPETLAGYRERGVLRRLQASPMRPWQVLGAHAATQALVTAGGLVLLVVIAIAAYDVRQLDATGLAAFATALLVAFAAVVSVGFLIAGMAPTTRTAQAVASALYFPAIFISGAVIPREGLPAAVRTIGDWLPFTYVVDAVRTAWWDSGFDLRGLGIGIATAVLTAALATRLFRWS